MNKTDIMNMSPNDYIKIIEKKDTEIQKLKKIIEDTTENMKLVGRQNTRLKKELERYGNKLNDMYLKGYIYDEGY